MGFIYYIDKAIKSNETRSPYLRPLKIVLESHVLGSKARMFLSFK